MDYECLVGNTRKKKKEIGKSVLFRSRNRSFSCSIYKRMPHGGFGGGGGFHGGWHGGPGYYGGGWPYWGPGWGWGVGGALPFIGGVAVGSELTNGSAAPLNTTIVLPPNSSSNNVARPPSAPVYGGQNMMQATVHVPNGVGPGQQFMFRVDGEMFQVKCPDYAHAGEDFIVNIPPTSSQQVQRAQASYAARVQSTTSLTSAVLIKDHIVDEHIPPYSDHHIISGNLGDIVTILDGTIDKGMQAPYTEYCTVRFADGREGKISRFILRPTTQEQHHTPPKAIT
jgi:hypothetical protein